MNAAELAPFKQLIKTRCGLLLEGVGEDPLVVAIGKRMAALGAASPPVYFTRLVARDDEFQEFVTLLTINETYFFREPDQLTLLVERIVPRLLADSDVRLPIRILSAGCSTGEEPYSIAMALLEKYGESALGMVRILGGDIDHHALAKARSGRYGAFSFRGMPPELRDRYFQPVDRDHWQVNEKVRGMVEFHALNLLADSFPAALDRLDVVFFRNVSIYFDQPTRRTIHQSFNRMMTGHGHLVIGSAETLANDLGVFRMVQDCGAFFFVKGAVPAATPAPPPPRAVVTPFPLPQRPRPSESVAPPPRPAAPPPAAIEDSIDVETIRTLIRDKRFDRLDLVLTPRNRREPADPVLLALEGYGRLMNRDFAAAAELGQRALATDEWSVDAMVLQGLAAKYRGNADEAVRWFKQAVYVRQDCWPAHYYLADLLRAGGSVEPARRGYRAALAQLAAHPDPDGGLALPLGLPLAEIRFLCERHAGAGAQPARR